MTKLFSVVKEVFAKMRCGLAVGVVYCILRRLRICQNKNDDSETVYFFAKNVYNNGVSITEFAADGVPSVAIWREGADGGKNAYLGEVDYERKNSAAVCV